MGMAEYIAQKFMGREICMDLDDESETIFYAEIWAKNKELFQGLVHDVVAGVVELELPGTGIIGINADFIKVVWEPSLNWRGATKGSLTGRPLSANRR
jgi:hypothetical protein